MRINFKKLSLNTALLAIVIFIFSLGIYERNSMDWADSRSFEIKAQQVSTGIPQWFVVNSITSNGAAPPLSPEYLPDIEKFQPRFDINYMKLAISIVGSVILALLLRVIVYLTKQKALWSKTQIPLIGLAFFTGVITPTDPEFGGLCLFILLIVLMGFVGWVTRKLSCVTISAVLTVMTLWWTMGMTDHFRHNHICQKMNVYGDLLPMTIFIPIFFIAGSIPIFIAHLIKKYSKAVKKPVSK